MVLLCQRIRKVPLRYRNLTFRTRWASAKEELGKKGCWVEVTGRLDCGTMNKFIPGSNTIITSNIAIADNRMKRTRLSLCLSTSPRYPSTMAH